MTLTSASLTGMFLITTNIGALDNRDKSLNTKIMQYVLVQ